MSIVSIIKNKGLTPCHEWRLKSTERCVTMSDPVKAAQVDPLEAFVQGADDQDTKDGEKDGQQADSAPVVDADKTVTTEADNSGGDGVQNRINKITADKYAEKRRADALQLKVDAFEKKNATPALKEPTLEDPEIDYDEEKLNTAKVAYQVQEGVKNGLANHETRQAEARQQVKNQELADTFEKQVTDLGKADFNVKADAIPALPDGVAGALMQMKDGADLIYHLGDNLDKADAISKMSSEMAMVEIGKLSSALSVKPDIKPSAAPDPIIPVSAGGGALSSEIDDDMPIGEWMAKFG